MPALTLTSSAFGAGEEIPVEHTCEGADRSPPLSWSGAPPQTLSFALIVDDPDAPDPRAPKRTYVHWVLYDVSSSASELGPGSSGGRLPAGAREGKNDGGTAGYTGPCPPIGRHRYFFKLFALNALLGDLGRPTKATLMAAMEGHVIAQAELVGTYESQRG